MVQNPHIQAAPTHGNVIRQASTYDALVHLLTFGQAAAIRKRTADLAQIQRGQRVLDVGCGTGDLTMVAKERVGANGQVAGIDPSPEMLAVASRKAEAKGVAIDYRLGVIEALPFAEESFDVVVSSLMMHHLPENLKRQGLAEVYRVLSPNGRILVVDFRLPTTFLGKSLLNLLLHGGLHVGVAELTSTLEKTGFHDITVGKLNVLALSYVSALAKKDSREKNGLLPLDDLSGAGI